MADQRALDRALAMKTAKARAQEGGREWARRRTQAFQEGGFHRRMTFAVPKRQRGS